MDIDFDLPPVAFDNEASTLHDGIKQIQLTRGYVAVVDDVDYPRVCGNKWRAQIDYRTDGSVRNVYAARANCAGGLWRTELMHRVIIGAASGVQIDHIDGNGLNNCRSNLRECTNAENSYNQNHHGGTSKFKGVRWHKCAKKWNAYIRINGTQKHLGTFNTEDDAALAYNKEAVIRFGKFARTNNIGGDAVVALGNEEKQFISTVSTMSDTIHRIAVNHGWWNEDRNDGELIALMHSELSEALEALRAGNPPDDHIPQFSGVEAELADVIIRALDMSAARGYDVAGAIVAKVAYNEGRAYKHGGKKF